MEKRSKTELYKHLGDYRIDIEFLPGGWRCGYIGVMKGHPLYEKDECEYPCELEPHGGITFSGFRPHVGGNDAGNYIWWFGFDCAHYGDGYDIESLRKYFPDYSDFLLSEFLHKCLPHYSDSLLPKEEDHVWSFDDVLQEILRWLVDIMEWVDKEKVEPEPAIKDAWLYDGSGPMKCSRCGYENCGPISDIYCPECGVRLWGVRTV